MCGITGFISSNFNKLDLVKMTEAIRHRGPDAEGHYYHADKGIGLGHRRLSIIDLSDAANQPMYSSCGRYIIVYNGEVYNFKEIALKLDDIKWKTRSDTEVILEAFAKWGVDFVHELNGMFAIAIYDQREEKLYLFRDRMGIKPLYYYHDGSDFAFASEIKAINQLALKKEIDEGSIYAYLHLGYIPSNKTIYQNLFKVKSGAYLIVEKNQVEEIGYWNPEAQIQRETIKDLETSKSQLRSLLQESVKKRLVSDVPIGTFLSGGTDSSMVTAIAQEVNDSPINTFSIGFKEGKYNESEHARKVARHLGTNHHEFILSEEDALNELENIMDHFDEPYADSSALPTMLVSKMARKHVTVCLSGDGGDELFMGYGAYRWGKRLSNPIYWSLRHPIAKILSLSSEYSKLKASLIFDSPKANWKSHVFSQENLLFSEKEINNLFRIPFNPRYVNEANNNIPLARKLNSSETQALFDLNYYLKDDLLVKVDRSSMYCSLEGRVPLLDHRLVEFALNLDPKLKMNYGIQKYLLKELLNDYVPKSIMERPKWGFSIPLEKWLSNDLKFLIDRHLSKNSIEELRIFDSNYVSSLINRFYKGEIYLYNRLWALIILIKFMKEN